MPMYNNLCTLLPAQKSTPELFVWFGKSRSLGGIANDFK
ncbi:hypothetical protein CIPOMM044M_02980 [Citrobacter portucalensis]